MAADLLFHETLSVCETALKREAAGKMGFIVGEAAQATRNRVVTVESLKPKKQVTLDSWWGDKILVDSLEKKAALKKKQVKKGDGTTSK
jgi:hypothetical protein